MRLRILEAANRSLSGTLALLLSLLALAVALPALAQDADDADPDAGADADDSANTYARDLAGSEGLYSRKGFHFQGMAVYAIEHFAGVVQRDAAGFIGPFVADLAKTSNSLGADGRFGYRFHKNISAEIEYEWLNDFQVGTSSGIRFGRINMWNVSANAKGYLLTGRYQPYLMLGAGYGKANVSGPFFTLAPDGFIARMGGGIDIYANEDVGLAAEVAYVLPAGSLASYDYLSIGLGFFVRYYADN